MATKRRPYVLIADSIFHEPWTDNQLATMVRLCAAMHERWRTNQIPAEQASTIHLNKTALMAISGKRRADVALTSLERLADVLSISIERFGDVTAIQWPKWAEYQGLTARQTPDVRPSNAPPNPNPNPRPEEDKKLSGGGRTEEHKACRNGHKVLARVGQEKNP